MRRGRRRIRDWFRRRLRLVFDIERDDLARVERYVAPFGGLSRRTDEEHVRAGRSVEARRHGSFRLTVELRLRTLGSRNRERTQRLLELRDAILCGRRLLWVETWRVERARERVRGALRLSGEIPRERSGVE